MDIGKLGWVSICLRVSASTSKSSNFESEKSGIKRKLISAGLVEDDIYINL